MMWRPHAPPDPDPSDIRSGGQHANKARIRVVDIEDHGPDIEYLDRRQQLLCVRTISAFLGDAYLRRRRYVVRRVPASVDDRRTNRHGEEYRLYIRRHALRDSHQPRYVPQADPVRRDEQHPSAPCANSAAPSGVLHPRRGDALSARPHDSGLDCLSALRASAVPGFHKVLASVAGRRLSENFLSTRSRPARDCRTKSSGDPMKRFTSSLVSSGRQ